MSSKQYGLTIPKKKPTFQKTLKPRLAVFGDDSGDELDGHKDVNAQIHKEAMKKIVKKQTKLEIQKAMEQDATVYEYDSIYDDMKQKIAVKNLPAAVLSADKQKKPKYIGQLIKAAEHRAKEKLRVEERTIERERKKEGDQFSDKPAFVTSAYKKRMEERQKEEEEERRQAAIEDAMDVRKQRDLSGFYKHFLNRQVGEPSIKTEPEVPTKSDVPATGNSPDNDDADTDLSFSDSDDDVKVTRDHHAGTSRDKGKLDSRDHSKKHSRDNRERDLRDNRERDSRDNSEKHSRDNRERDSRDNSEKHSRDNRERDSRDNSEKHSRDNRERDSRDNRERDSRDIREKHSRDNSEKHSRDSRDKKRDSRRSDDDNSRRPKREDLHLVERENTKRTSKERSNPEPQKRHRDDVKHPPQSTDKEPSQTTKFVKHSTNESVMSAKERYLARKKASMSIAVVEED